MTNVPRLNILQCALLSVCILASTYCGGAERTQTKNIAADDNITKLLRERLALYVEAHKSATKAYESGELGLAQVLEAKAKVLVATLDLCVTKTERIGVHEEMVKLAEQKVAAYEALTKAQESTRMNLLNSKAQLLEERIALEKARAAQ